MNKEKKEVRTCKAVQELQERAVADYKQKVIEEVEKKEEENCKTYANKAFLLFEELPVERRVQMIAETFGRSAEVVKMWLADVLTEPTKM